MFHLAFLVMTDRYPDRYLQPQVGEAKRLIRFYHFTQVHILKFTFKQVHNTYYTYVYREEILTHTSLDNSQNVWTMARRLSIKITMCQHYYICYHKSQTQIITFSRE